MKTGSKKPINQDIIFWAIFSGLILLRLLLVTGIPKMIIYGPHDDLFFARAAHSLFRGMWMGSYDQFTLIKGPFYAFFLVGSFLTGLPLYLTETLFFIGACVVLFFALEPMIENRWVRLIGLSLMLFIPSGLATWFHLRIYREFVYFSLTLYVTACALGLFLRASGKPKVLMPWSIGLGLAMGAFMLTREEGVWIYPVLLLLMAGGVFLILKNRGQKKWQRSILFILPVILWYLPIIIVSWINAAQYGYFGITEQLDKDFNSVLNALARIETTGDWHPAIQISKNDRLAAYDVSPTLQDYSETIEAYVQSYNQAENGSMSLKPAWYLKEYGDGGGELGNSHFPWLLRDVFAHNGLYNRGRYPREIYQQIADELEGACQDGDLDCSSKSILPGVISGIDRRHLPILFRMLGENFIQIAGHEDVVIQSMKVNRSYPAFTGDADARLVFEQFAYNPIDPVQAVADDQIPAVIYGVTDLRFRIIQYKETAMDFILGFFQLISRPLFFLALLSWLALIVLTLFKITNEKDLSFFATAAFVLGLFLTRLTTLTVLDATSSIPAIKYGASIHLFGTLFSFIMLVWISHYAVRWIKTRRTRHG